MAKKSDFYKTEKCKVVKKKQYTTFFNKVYPCFLKTVYPQSIRTFCKKPPIRKFSKTSIGLFQKSDQNVLLYCKNESAPSAMAKAMR